VGCNDGYVYALEAATGRLLWRFRAAPVERRVMVFGELWSTWPVNSGVLVQDGVVYAAAGIINYDGTHVYALDAVTGRIKWQNNRSGHLNPDLRCGASVQGNLALAGGKLWLAGGNVTSPAAYDLTDGRCLNPPPNAGWPAAPRGSEVCGVLGKYVLSGGRRLFTQDDDPITNWAGFEVFSAENAGTRFESRFQGRVPPAFGQGIIAMAGRGPVVCLGSDKVDGWLQTKRTGVQLDERWRAESIQNCVGVALAANAVVAVGEPAGSPSPAAEWTVRAFDLKDGHALWAERLESAPLPGGLCIDRDGRVIVVLENGRVVGVG
jgi:outer membrane protein assembly factor BamB